MKGKNKKKIDKKNKTVFTYSFRSKRNCVASAYCLNSLAILIVYLYVLVFFHIMFTAYIFLHMQTNVKIERMENHGTASSALLNSQK